MMKIVYENTEKRCPACASTDIKSLHPIEPEHHAATCNKCGAHWFWEWACIGFSGLQSKEEYEKELNYWSERD